MFDPAAFQALRKGAWGAELEWVEETASTQALAKAAPKLAGAVFGAEAQTAGKGRWGRQWEGVAGQSLLFTIQVPAQGTLSQAPLVLGVGLAQSLGVQLRWPNDLVWHGKKLGGFLVEQEGEWLLAGLGLNVGQTSFEEPLKNTATSLKLIGSQELRREPLMAKILLGMETTWSEWKHLGFEPIRLAWEKMAEGMGQPVTVQPTAGEAWDGILEGLEASGALKVRSKDGVLKTVASAEVMRLTR